MTTDWPEVAVPGTVPPPDTQAVPVAAIAAEINADEEKKERKSASTMLVELAMDAYVFGVSDAGETYGVPRVGPKVVFTLRGGKSSLRAQLARAYFARTGRAAPQQALADALLVVEGLAQDATEQRLYLRVAQHGGDLWLDLGDHTGRAVRISAGKWTVEEAAPVLFKRTALNGPLPEPARGGQLAELWPWLNLTPEDRPLGLAFIVAALFCDIPHPVLGLFGEQGTGKSTTGKILVSVIDPGPVPARKPPKDAESWVTAAMGSWVVGLDNLSDMQPWLSDSICRAVTGDGDVRRRLYTDGDFAVFAFRRVVVINGIDLGALRGDFAERLLPIDLDRIPDEARTEEGHLWPAWTKAHPRILGALLDLAASVARVLPSLHLESKPRMADFARILAAVDTVLGTQGLTRYLRKQGTLATESLGDDAFIAAIVEKFAGKTFTGTSADLLAAITPAEPPKDWPATARQVTTRLRRQAPVMRKAKWTVDDDKGANRRNAVSWAISPPREAESGASRDSSSSRTPADASDASDASDARHESGTSQVDGACRVCGTRLDPAAGGDTHPGCGDD